MSILFIQRKWRFYIIYKKSIKNKNNRAIIIQKLVRKYLAFKIFEQEKNKDKCFKNLSSNFKKTLECPKTREDFRIFETDILSKLEEMKKLL